MFFAPVMYISFAEQNKADAPMTPLPEFSRLLAIEGMIPDRPRLESIEASEAECEALARRFDLRALQGLKSKMSIIRVSEGHIIRIKGELEARVVQTCVVSLQDVPAEIRTQFEACFTEDGKGVEEQDGEEIFEEGQDLPDVMSNGQLDLGELVAQHLSLELDPYPRAPGVSLASQLAESGINAKNRPFQVLEGLKPEQKNKEKDK